MGIPIEHEHTGDKILATDIALQHLDEIPDYYTRLKKMEASAKKEHKKFKDVKEGAVQDLEAGLKKLDNTSYNSIDKLMRRIMKNKGVSAKKLHNDFVNKYHTTPDTWIKKQMKEDLGDWFGKGKEGGVGGGGWDRYNSKGERIGKCARENPSEAKPKCLSKEKATQLRSQGGAKAIANAVKRKRQQDPISDRSGKGGKPIMVSNRIKEAKEENRYCKLCGKMETRNECSWGGDFWDEYSIKKYDPNMPHPGNFPESFEINPSEHNKAKRQAKIANLLKGTKNTGEKEAAERKLKGPKLPSFKEQYIQEKNAPTNPSLWSRIKARAKSKFDVYPSAYANGWAAKEYKKAGGGWKTVSENNLIQSEVKEDCWSGYVQKGLKKKGNKMVPNCVPSKGVPKAKGYQKEDITIEDANGNTFVEIVDLIVPGQLGQTVENKKTFENFVLESSAAWQRKEGKNSKGGLNEKGRKSYEREHLGSDLKAPQPKGGSRRDSFCARMKGMKAKLTSAKTAHDPDSRINKSLRAWNC